MAIRRPRPRTGIIPLPPAPPGDYLAWAAYLRRADVSLAASGVLPPDARHDLHAFMRQIAEQASEVTGEDRADITPLLGLKGRVGSLRLARLVRALEHLEAAGEAPGADLRPAGARLVALRWRVALTLRREAEGRGFWGLRGRRTVRLPDPEVLETTPPA